MKLFLDEEAIDMTDKTIEFDDFLYSIVIVDFVVEAFEGTKKFAVDFPDLQIHDLECLF